MLYKRKLLDIILKWLDKPEIIVLLGSRQVGKTSLIKLIFGIIKNKSKVYLDLEDLNLRDICNKGVASLLKYLQLNGYNIKRKIIVALDEIQYLENPSNLLKLLYDHHPNIKLIVSGSSSFDIKRKFQDSLTGRKIIFEVKPLDFEEFLLFKNEEVYKLKKKIGNFVSILQYDMDKDIYMIKDNILPYFEEYLIYGGYPRISLEEDKEAKGYLLKEIYQSYIQKDVKDIARIDNISGFNNLVKVLSFEVSNLLNYNSISNTLGINKITLERYIMLLEKTFILRLLPPFFRNKRKEVSKVKKIFFNDNGLVNIINGDLRIFQERNDIGKLFESFVFNQLLQNFDIGESLFYWRTQTKAEVDFVIKYHNLIYPIEVKSTVLSRPVMTKSFMSFVKKYKVRKGFIVNLNYLGIEEYNGCKVYFVPGYLM